MTVETTQRRVSYTGDGVTTAFPVPFQFAAAGDLQVTGGAGYSVTGAGDPHGGAVVFSLAPAAGAAVEILRVVQRTQDTQYVPNDPFPAKAHEAALDKLTMIVQEDANELLRLGLQLAEEIATTLRVGASAAPLASLTPEPGKIIGFNASNQPVLLTPGGADAALRTDIASAIGASLVGTSAGFSVQHEIDRIANGQFFDVTRWGVVGDGDADDTEALEAMTAAVNSMWTLGDPPISAHFPPGTYRYSGGLEFDVPVTLTGDDATLAYEGDSFAIRLGPTDLLNSPEAFSYQEMTVDGLRITGGRDAVHGIYVADSIFEPRIRNVTFIDFGSGTGGSVYGIFMQANNWNALVENCRMFVLNEPEAEGVNFICVNGVSENLVPDGGNSRVTIRDCWMTSYNETNLGIYANLNATASRIVGGGFQWSSFGIFLRPACNDVTIDSVYCEMYGESIAMISHSSSGSGPTYQSPQKVKLQNIYCNLHQEVPVVDARVIKPFDATARLVGWEIDNLTVAGITADYTIVEQNNLSGQRGNRFQNVRALFVPESADTGANMAFPQILSNVENWTSSDGVIGVGEITGTTYTLTVEDVGRIGLLTGASAAVTVPPTGTPAQIPIGAELRLRNGTGGTQTIVAGSGVTLSLAGSALTGTRTLASNALATLTCIGADLWLVDGAGVT